MNKDNSLAIRFGLIAGLLFTLLSFGCWAAGIKVFGNFLIWSTWIPIFFVIILIGAFQRRKQLGGFMSYKEGLVFAFLAYVIFEVFVAVSTFVLFRLIDPQLQDKVFIYVVEVTRNFMKSIGSSDSQVEDAIERAQEMNQEAYTLKQIILGFGMNLIWDFVKSLIIALISHRKKPEFGDVRDTNL